MSKYECPHCGWKNLVYIIFHRVQCTSCKRISLLDLDVDERDFKQYEGWIPIKKVIVREEE